MNNKSNKNRAGGHNRSEKNPFDMRAPFIFCVAEAIVMILFCAFVFNFANTEVAVISPVVIALLVAAAYLLSAGSVCLFYILKYRKLKAADNREREYNTDISAMFRSTIDFPYALVDLHGDIKVMNGSLQKILGYSSAVSRINISDVCSVPFQQIMARAENREEFNPGDVFDLPEEHAAPVNLRDVLSDGKVYEIASYIMRKRGVTYYLITFKDINDFDKLKKKTDFEEPVVAYIMLDNLQELAQYVRADYRAASAEIENILKDWVTGMRGFIREYDRDRYIATFPKGELASQISDGFTILKNIMGLKIGDNSFPVTVSMGIASFEGSMQKKEKEAFAALELAIKRGGNQVAVRQSLTDGCKYFGGTHKTMENSTAVTSRVSGEILEEQIKNSSNVLIMGHANPDFDSIGSCVGMARFAMEVAQAKGGKAIPVNIVVDKDCESFKICERQLSPMKIYDEIFIRKVAAADLVTPTTLLIICDVNNPYIFEFPELARTAQNIALIDHHRLGSELSYAPFLQYVETTKSSTSEIVSEIFMQSRFADTLHKEEAEILMSGIMLDTNNFTRNSGAQTFATSHYLYGRGAHTEVVREFFNEHLEEVLLTSNFEAKTEIYRDSAAIACMVSERNSAEDRIIAAKVANNLLSVIGVEASFAVMKIGDDIGISARSKGRVNVQLILERLFGGGHFDMAGAQLRGTSLEDAYEQLKAAIDDYYLYDYVKTTEN